MAITYTVTGAGVKGNTRYRYGTFTSAAGDGNGETLTNATHGLNHIIDYKLTLDTGGLNVPAAKVTVSSGTLTWTVDDTLGYSGKWYVCGR